nr:hypothetical protein GCM10025730_03780 [Promicromonospora thailandica]
MNPTAPAFAPALPTIADVLAAQARLDGTVVRTPVGEYAELARATGTTVVVKHENQQRTGAFKARGATNLLLSMTPAERARGVVAYSTGNHAQGIAYAARLTGTACTIVMPDDPNPLKLRAVLDLGADVMLHGATFDDARTRATALAGSRGRASWAPRTSPTSSRASAPCTSSCSSRHRASTCSSSRSAAGPAPRRPASWPRPSRPAPR